MWRVVRPDADSTAVFMADTAPLRPCTRARARGAGLPAAAGRCAQWESALRAAIARGKAAWVLARAAAGLQGPGLRVRACARACARARLSGRVAGRGAG